MFTTYHPDQLQLIAGERTARLFADAAAWRARRFVAEWRPARLLQPTLDLDRLPAARPAPTGRAA
jgi:hypothetical protein